MTLKDLMCGKRENVDKKISYSNVLKSKHIALAFRKNGSLITLATNQLIKGHKSKFSLHAEEALIIKLKKLRARERLGPLTVLVMRWSSLNKYCLSKPCKNCRRLLEEYGIHTILFTTNEGNIT